METGNGRTFMNWAESYQCTPKRYFYPTTREQVSEILQLARKDKCKVRLLGCGHSPSDLPFTDDYLIVTTSMDKVLHIDKEKCIIKVEAGIQVRDLNLKLESEGLSISVLGSVDDITIGGAISTGTHGTGAKFKALPNYVKELELMRADGEVMVVSRDRDEQLFRAVSLSLGCMGVLLSVTLQCEKFFYLHETHSPTTLDEALENLDAYLEASDHFRFTWYPYAEVQLEQSTRQKDTKEIKDDGASWFWDYGVGFYLLQLLYWIAAFYEGLIPHINRFFYRIQYSVRRQKSDKGYNLFKFECLFKQYVEEWAIPREHTGPVMRELRQVIEGERIPAHFPLEVRFVQTDDLMLSPASARDICYINIVSYRPFKRNVEHGDYFKKYEEIMKKYDGRPHWAKDHGQTAEQFKEMYPEWKTFCDIRKKMDPGNLFINKNLEVVFGSFL